MSAKKHFKSEIEIPGQLCFLGKKEPSLLFTVQMTSNPYCIYSEDTGPTSPLCLSCGSNKRALSTCCFT